MTVTPVKVLHNVSKMTTWSKNYLLATKEREEILVCRVKTKALNQNSPSGKSQWTPQWSPLRLDFYPFSGGESQAWRREEMIHFEHFVTFIHILLDNTSQAFNLKKLVHVFVWSFISNTGVGVPSHHVIDWLHYCQHFLPEKKRLMC